MPIVVSAVSSRADLRTFIRLPMHLYKGMAGYLPPLLMDREALLDPRKAAFFSHGRAQYFLARQGGKVVGRISAQIDLAQPTGTFDDAGLFGCLDAIDDADVVRALLQAAEAWLVEQGRTRAAGPFVLNMNGEPGLLVHGQEEPPLSLVSWHPAYLAEHVAAAGYTPAKDLHYWRLSALSGKLDEFSRRRRPQLGGSTISARKLDMAHLARDIEIIREVYNDAWLDNWGFVPLQPADVSAISKDMKPFVKPEYGVIVERAGKPMGVALIFPNLFEVTTDVGPDPSLVGWGKLAYRALFHRFQTGFIILLGVLREVRHSVGGAVIGMTLIDEMVSRFLDYDASAGWVEAGWVLDDNAVLQKILVQYGFERVRTLRLFDKSIQ